MFCLPWIRRNAATYFSRTTQLQSRSHKNRSRLVSESLESRCLLALTPTGSEQEMLELVNQLRNSPSENFDVMVADAQVSAFMTNANVNLAVARNQFRALAGGIPPLAWDEGLLASSDQHSATMRTANQLSHSGFSPEAIAAANITAPTQMQPITLHAQLAIDFVTRGSAGDANRDGILDDPGHRELLLANDLHNIGIGILTNRRGSQNEMWVTQHFDADAAADNPYVLGVVYNDANNSGRYNAGEGLTGVTISLVGASRTFTTTTLGSGGYQIRVPAGTYTVTASGSTLNGNVAMGTVTVGSDNVKRDLNTRGSTPPVDDPDTGGQISGFIFTDGDRDGRRDAGEVGVGGWTIFADTNNNGQRDTGEKSTTSTNTGFYRLTGLPVGTITVRAVPKAGTYPTVPLTIYVETSATGAITGKHFGASTTATRGSVSGFVYHDLNLDGRRQSTDAAIANWTVFVDADNNGAYDSGEQFVRTSSTGFYRFDGLAPGNHTIRIASTTTRGFSPFTSSARVVSVATGVIKGGNHFGLTNVAGKATSVTGFVFEDRDLDKRRDSNESGVANQIVYVDANKNGKRDATEVFLVTTQTGFYRFAGLGAGRHVIGIELLDDDTTSEPTSHIVDLVLGQTLVAKNFGL